jgi:hypothetical protein
METLKVKRAKKNQMKKKLEKKLKMGKTFDPT